MPAAKKRLATSVNPLSISIGGSGFTGYTTETAIKLTHYSFRAIYAAEIDADTAGQDEGEETMIGSLRRQIHFQPATLPACSIHLCIPGLCASSSVFTLT
jgi:hypothetical protein